MPVSSTGMTGLWNVVMPAHAGILRGFQAQPSPPTLSQAWEREGPMHAWEDEGLQRRDIAAGIFLMEGDLEVFEAAFLDRVAHALHQGLVVLDIVPA